MTQQGFLLVMKEMRHDPCLRGPDGVDFSQTNQWCTWFNEKLKFLSESIGEAKLQLLTDSMDFMRCLFGWAGKRGSIVVCYLCSKCKSCPKFDFHWCVVHTSKGDRWSCCGCGDVYSPGDPTAFLFGIQISDKPGDIEWWVAHPPTGHDQNLMNLLKAINGVR